MPKYTHANLWPTYVGFYEANPLWDIHKSLYEYAIASAPNPNNASERRVRNILDENPSGLELRSFLFSCVKHYLNEYAEYLDEDYCENRALVIKDRGFINTHKDNREGDITCVYFLTGNGVGEPINSVGNPRFVLEDASRYFDEPRLPFESRHGYSVNPRPGLAAIFPSYVPHNMHPYKGTSLHVQIVANFRVDLPTKVEERLFD
jgi:hypothetical protein